MPLGTGLAFANKYRGNGRVCLTYFGDGAANQGQVYESFNMAELWKLPVIYIIENNHYAMGTSVERARAAPTDFSQRGAVVRHSRRAGRRHGRARRQGRAATRAVAHAAHGKGPYILEMQTYRYRGHSMSDPAKYRTREEVQEMREQRDPIEQVRKRLLEEGTVERGRAEGDRRARSARSSTRPPSSPSNDPEPDAAELCTDVDGCRACGRAAADADPRF